MKRLLVIGGGFAGLWAALAAAREADLRGAKLRITLLSRDSCLVIRPRLYEAPHGLRVPLAHSLQPAGIGLLEGRVLGIDPAAQAVEYAAEDGGVRHEAYDRLVVALGSLNSAPDLPGREHAWSVDRYETAVDLDEHLRRLGRMAGEGDGTFVVIGAGFTGLEVATELRQRIGRHAGPSLADMARLVLVDRNEHVGHTLGPGPRPVIEDALNQARIERRLGVGVERLDPHGVLLSNGEWLASRTAILTMGMRAAPLPGLPGPRDALGRVVVDDALRVAAAPGVFAAGDSACARVDADGHVALQSCQHAMTMGRFAGHNAARELLGLEPRPYRQPFYVTCLDLGPAGAVLTTGWERQVALSGAAAKAVKQAINRAIHPPTGSREQILALAGIEHDDTAALRALLKAA